MHQIQTKLVEANFKMKNQFHVGYKNLVYIIH